MRITIVRQGTVELLERGAASASQAAAVARQAAMSASAAAQDATAVAFSKVLSIGTLHIRYQGH